MTRRGDRCAGARASVRRGEGAGTGRDDAAVSRNDNRVRGEGTTFSHWVCEERGGPTPIHPEPGRETSQRRSYWRLSAGNLGPRTQPMMTPGNQIRLPGVVCLVHALFTGRSRVAMPPSVPVVGRSTTPHSGAAPEREWIEAAAAPATTYQWLVGGTPCSASAQD